MNIRFRLASLLCLICLGSFAMNAAEWKRDI